MSAFDNVLKLIKEWRSEVQPTELKYRDALIVVLRERLKEAQIEKEYRHAGTTIDIYVKQSGFWGDTASCTIIKTLIIVAVGILFGFSERTLTSLEQKVLGGDSGK